MFTRLTRSLPRGVGPQGQIALKPRLDVVLHLDQLIEAHLAPLILQIANLTLGADLTVRAPLGDLLLLVETAQVAEIYHRPVAVDAVEKRFPFGAAHESGFGRKLDLIAQDLTGLFFRAVGGVAPVSRYPYRRFALPLAKLRFGLLPACPLFILLVAFCHSVLSSQS